MKTSAQVVGTSGSQKSCMICFQQMTSQGVFRLGQLKCVFFPICDTWFKKKKIGSRLKADRTLAMGREINRIIYYLVLFKEFYSIQEREWSKNAMAVMNNNNNNNNSS